MKKLKHHIIAALILIGCHSMEAAWRDWLSWTNWKNWFSSTLIDQPYSPIESKETTTKAATALVARAFQQKQAKIKSEEYQESEKFYQDIMLDLLPEETEQKVEPIAPETTPVQALPSKPAQLIRSSSQEMLIHPEENLSNDLILFFDKAHPFFFDLSDVRWKRLPFEQLQQKYQATKGQKSLFDELDDIARYGMPKSIFNQPYVLDNPTLKNQLIEAFDPLKSNLPWKYLTDDKAWQGKKLKRKLIEQLAYYIRNTNGWASFKNYETQLTNMLTSNPERQLKLPLPTTNNMAEFLKMLRAFKIKQDYEGLRDHKAKLTQGINIIYKNFLPQEKNKPDLTFIHNFA